MVKSVIIFLLFVHVGFTAKIMVSLSVWLFPNVSSIFGFRFKPKLNILLFDLQCLPFSVSFLQKGETIVRISSLTEIEFNTETNCDVF